MLPRRLKTILQTSEQHRFSVLAEGLEMLADNVTTLEADAAELGAAQRIRSVEILRSFAEEEAAKALILLDIARVGWKAQDAVSRCLSSFYSHLARGLYVRAYDGRPADLDEVRRYVDELRQEFHLDGPMDVDWILGNEVLANREERLYVDYVEDEKEKRRWAGPADRVASDGFADFTIASEIVRLVEAMQRIGLLTEEGLIATRTVWQGVIIDNTMKWQDLRQLNVSIVQRLVDVQDASCSDETRDAARYVVEHWIFPMATLDLALAEVDRADLERVRQRWLAHQMGVDGDP